MRLKIARQSQESLCLIQLMNWEAPHLKAVVHLLESTEHQIFMPLRIVRLKDAALWHISLIYQTLHQLATMLSRDAHHLQLSRSAIRLLRLEITLLKIV